MTFKNTPYKQYPNSFLSVVTLSLKFERNKALSDAEFMTNLKEYADAFFSLKINESREFNGLLIKRADNKVTYSFGKTEAAVEILGDVYKNYTDSQLPCLARMIDYIKKVVGPDKVKEIAVRKVNKWNFKNDGQKPVTADAARDFVFSAEFLKSLSSDNLSSIERVVDNFMKVEDVINGNKVSIRTAYLTDQKDAGITGLILDSVSRKNVEDLTLSELPNECKNINKLLFDAFHWCVKEEIISMMEK